MQNFAIFLSMSKTTMTIQKLAGDLPLMHPALAGKQGVRVKICMGEK